MKAKQWRRFATVMLLLAFAATVGAGHPSPTLPQCLPGTGLASVGRENIALALPLCLPGTPLKRYSAGQASAGREVFLPVVQVCGGGPRVVDQYGEVRDCAWLWERFGSVAVQGGDGAARVVELRESEGPAAVVVHVVRDGLPLEGVNVVLNWPDAPPLPEGLRQCSDYGVYGPTNSMGDVGFGLGGGSYYFPPAGGPHWIWVAVEGTDCLTGIGMLGGTNHVLLNSTWEVR